MTLPRHSSLKVAWRQTVRNALSVTSFIYDPLRARLRTNSLARASVAPAKADPGDSPPVLLLMVYRATNVQFVQLLLRQTPSGADVRLWALDEIAPELAAYTLGYGAGVRFAHLNFLYGARDVAPGSWIVLADDDIYFQRGDVATTIRLMGQADFSLAQPGQSVIGWWTDLFSVARPLVTARDTNCVEQGPLVIASPVAARSILPLPTVNDMGWGIEAEWYRLKEGNFRTGIIDACRIVHCGKVADSYSVGPEMKRMHERLSAAGIQTIWQLRSVNGYWWSRQRAPSWR